MMHADTRAILLRPHCFRVLFLVLAVLGSTAVVHAATATWNVNPESDIKGYILSYGTQTGVHPTSVDVGNVTTWQVTTLTPGQIYYFVVQAYNTSGFTSVNSAEVVFTDPITGVPTLTSLTPSSGAVGMPVTIAGNYFGATQSASTLTFNGTPATPTSWSGTSLSVLVPGGATTGPVVVTVGGLASNAVAFTVTLPLPAPWTAQDVGSPALAGSATATSGTFSVTGAGVDIWDHSDQFQFVYQTLVGDGEIVTRVDSLLNTNTMAKAGVM